MTGTFITFEGPEGAGKTTVVQRIYHYFLAKGIDVVMTREPGGISISEQIREIILNPAHTTMDGRTEALLYAAARRQHLVEKVIPALQANKLVLCDRFVDSSLAYQGYARGLGIDEVWAINQFAIQETMPQLTVYLAITPEVGLARIQQNGREVNRLDLESMQFHHDVHDGYKEVLHRFPERMKIVNAEQSIDDVVAAAIEIIEQHLQ